MVDANKEGLNVYYSLRRKKVVKAIDLLREFLVEQLDYQVKIGRAAGKSAVASGRR